MSEGISFIPVAVWRCPRGRRMPLKSPPRIPAIAGWSSRTGWRGQIIPIRDRSRSTASGVISLAAGLVDPED